MRIATYRVLVLILAVLHLYETVQAQSTKVELSGTISDPSALPVEGADVRLLNVNTDGTQSVSSGNDGRYHFFGLQPGTYAITVTKPGFAILRREVALRVGDNVAVDLALQIGAASESVN